MLLATCLFALSTASLDIVRDGIAENARHIRGEWKHEDGALVASGVGRQLLADARLGDGNWKVTVELSLDKFDGTAASLVLDSSNHIGFDGRGGGFFLEGSFSEGADRTLKFLEQIEEIDDGEPFSVSLERRGEFLSLYVNGKFVVLMNDARNFTTVSLRPHRSNMRVHSFIIEGEVTLGLGNPALEQVDVFVSGEGGYDTYRIPSLTVAPNGDLLAFCEGRKNSSSDSGNIDMLLRRSKDSGKTWLPTQVIWDDGKNTCGNPCVVVDKPSGTVHLLMTHNLGSDRESEIIAGTSEGTRTIWITSSKDDGETWSNPREITSSVKRDDWTWYATGPGAGIQLERGDHKGRLVVPADHIERDSKKYYSHVIYSDDGGATWQLGGSTPQDQTNECEVVELRDGWLLLNSRNYDRSKRTRQVSISQDGGERWISQTHDATLIEPICQASIRRLHWHAGDMRTGVILFSNPASLDSRRRMTVRASYDDARSWAKEYVIYEGPAAYSCLAPISFWGMGLLYEADEYGRIVFVNLVTLFLGP